MTRTPFLAMAAIVSLAASAWADGLASGDAAAGEQAFRTCIACHVVTNDSGETLAGRSGRIGPNLYGIAGRRLAAQDGFRYSPALAAAGAAGAVWDEESFVAFLRDPSAYLRQTLDDGSVRSAMAFRVQSEQDARDLYAFLASLSE